jgi:hypothetical protein
VLNVLQRKDLAARRKQQLLHVFAPHLEAAAGDAGDHWLAPAPAPVGLGGAGR